MLPALAAIVYRLLWIGLPLVLYAMSTTTGSSSSLFVGILQQQQQQQPEEQTTAAASGAAVLGGCEREGPKAPPLPCTSLSHVQALVDRAIRMDRNNNNNTIHIRLDACNGATLIPESNDDGDDEEEEEGVVMVRGVTGRERIVIACENANSPCYLFGLFSVENAASLTFRNIALDGRSRSRSSIEKKRKNFAAAAAAPPAPAAAAVRDSGPLLHVRGVPDVSVIGSFFLHGRSRSSTTTSAAEDDNSSNNNGGGGGGGGLIVQHGRRVRIRDSRFVGNTAARDGGGLYVDIANEDDDTNNNDSSVVTLQNITFTDCHAGRYGGGAYIGGADALDLNDAVWFERCTAERGGGGWFADDIIRTTSTKTRCNDCDIVGSSSGSSSNDENDDNGYSNNNNNNNCGGGCAFVRIRCFNGPNHLPPPCGGGFCESRLVLRSLHAANAATTGPRALRAAPVSVVRGGGGDGTTNNNGRCGGSGGGSDDDAPPPPPTPTTTNARLPPVFMDYKSSTGPSPVALDPQTEYYRLKIQDSLWCAF